MTLASRSFFCLVAMLLTLPSQPSFGQTGERLPNFVVIFTDDQGYGDVGCFGAKGYQTPNLDRMAREGMKFTSFYAAQAVCSASRAALLTGCYSNRVGIMGALGPTSKIGISADEMTLAEVLKQKNYATAAYGKWHLGHHRQFLPMQNGFDDYFGLPYSNDMWPFHPTSKRFPDLPMIERNKIIALNPDQTQLTTAYTEHAVDFIAKSKDKPFFLYLAHSMPHVPLFVSSKFKSKSEQGAYGDVIMEIDWSVGQVLTAIKENGLDDHTLVIFTSDNGPWLSYGNHAGSAGPLREGKGTTWEGGMREPCIMRWPGKIKPGTVCDELAGTIDILPTLAHLSGAPLPKKAIDGKNIAPLLMQSPGARTPHDAYFHYWAGHLQAVRNSRWKLHFPHSYRSLQAGPGKDGTPSKYVQRKTGLALFDLETDIGETTDVKDKYPDVVAELKLHADRMRIELGDTAQKIVGSANRKPGRITDDK